MAEGEEEGSGSDRQLEPKILTRPNQRYQPRNGSSSVDLRWVIFHCLQLILIATVFIVDYMSTCIEI